MSLKDQRVVVIGGTSGIGFAVAQRALAEGAAVVLGSSSEQKVAAARDRLPGASAFTVDVRDESSVSQFFERVGAFDHLVFTAGDWGRFGATALETVQVNDAAAIFGVRFFGAIVAIRHAAKQLRGAGSITLTNGMIAHRPRKGSAVSTAMAGAIEHLALGLAVELAPIRVNVVCPGLIRTEVWSSIPEAQREERLNRMTERLPIKRPGEPNEAAEAYLYLMRGGYTTAQVLRVDGGQTAL